MTFPHGAVGGLRCVNVVFPDHAHLIFGFITHKQTTHRSARKTLFRWKADDCPKLNAGWAVDLIFLYPKLLEKLWQSYTKTQFLFQTLKTVFVLQHGSHLTRAK